MTEDDDIEARKKKAERGWIVESARPRTGLSPGEEIEKWYAVIGPSHTDGAEFVSGPT